MSNLSVKASDPHSPSTNASTSHSPTAQTPHDSSPDVHSDHSQKTQASSTLGKSPSHPSKESNSHASPSGHNRASHGKQPPSVQTLERPGCERMPQKTPEELWDVAQCYFKMALHEKATDVLKEISRRNPHDLDAFFTASWLVWNHSLSKQGDIEKHLQEQSLEILNQAVQRNPTHWEAYVERGDHYYLRLANFTSAYVEYMRARNLYDGDSARSVKSADVGRKASIEARIGRTAEKLNRKGEAVEASCRALFFDPDDTGSKERVERLHGSCTRKKVPDPRTEEEKKIDAHQEKTGH